MKNILRRLPAILGITSCFLLHGQGTFVHERSARWGANLNDEITAVTLAEDGSMAICGLFTNTVDLDPGNGEVLVTATPTGVPGTPAKDVFMVKLNADGSFAWGVRLGNHLTTEVAGGCAFTADGHVLVACSFNGAVDVDPGPGEILTAAGANHTAVLKLDGTSGALLDHFIITSPVGAFFASAHTTFGLRAAPDGGFAIHGGFGDNLDLDPGTGTATVNTNGAFDAFVAKYSADMSFEWGFGLGGSGNFTDQVNRMRFGSDGSLYIGGFFNSGTDFDPGPGQQIIPNVGSASDGCVARYNADGTFAWVARFVSPGSGNDIHGLEVANGEVLVLGRYETSVDADPGASTLTLTPVSGALGTFVAKLSAATGGLVSATQFDQLTEPSTSGNLVNTRESTAMVGDDHFVFVGELSFGTYDMVIGPGTFNLQPNSGVLDLFVARYAWSDLSLSNAMRIGGSTGSDLAQGVASNAAGQFLVGGNFKSSTLNVNPQGTSVNLANAGGTSASDAFCVRYAYSASTNGVGDASRPIGMRCHPNPMNDALMVTGNSSVPVRVELLDMAGRVVLHAMGALPLTMDVSKVSPGAYHVRSISPDGINVITVVKD
ncbi:MAG: T9SS type A sorting domain-containing protein [Flavobacteriales bacterium]